MINPYDPPSNNLQYLPLRKRFCRALKRAINEYRSGLKRERMSSFEHVLAWLGLFLFGLSLLLAMVMLTVLVMLRLGILD